jgi:hypothetical protein
MADKRALEREFGRLELAIALAVCSVIVCLALVSTPLMFNERGSEGAIWIPQNVRLYSLSWIDGVGVIFALVFGLPIGLPAMLALGLPAHSILRRKAPWLPIYCAVGATIGVICIAIITLLAWDGSSIWILGAECGAAMMSTFWVIRRPDRDIAPTQASPAP